MRQTINAIRDAIEKECWLPALALALTIPDVMGQIVYPEYASPRGERLVRKQYKQWFHENVEPRFADHTGFDENWRANRPYFSAEMCYQLRCELLHSGSDDIDFEYGEREPGRDYTYDSELRVHACDSYGPCWADPCGEVRIEEHIHVCIDIKTLCDALSDGVERCLLNNSEDELARHEARIVNVAECAGISFRKVDDTQWATNSGFLSPGFPSKRTVTDWRCRDDGKLGAVGPGRGSCTPPPYFAKDWQ